MSDKNHPNHKQSGEQERPAATEVVERPANAGAITTVDDSMFMADAGGGMENATEDSFAIPFLSVLQTNSPQVDENDGKYIQGARAGMLYENVTNRLIDGKEGAVIIPVQYRREYLRWGPRGGEGAGFKGALTPDRVAEMRQKREIVELDGRLYFPLTDGTVNEKKCDRVVDTRNHYVLLVDEKTGVAVQALLSLRSTQVRKSKQLMSALASVRFNGPNGPYQPPTFANMVRVTTAPESNDEGKWFGVRTEVIGRVSNASHYNAAKAFNETVKKGAVQVRYEDTEEGAAPAGRGNDAGGGAERANADNRF